jgi:hypothetical protein
VYFTRDEDTETSIPILLVHDLHWRIGTTRSFSLLELPLGYALLRVRWPNGLFSNNQDLEWRWRITTPTTWMCYCHRRTTRLCRGQQIYQVSPTKTPRGVCRYCKAQLPSPQQTYPHNSQSLRIRQVLARDASIDRVQLSSWSNSLSSSACSLRRCCPHRSPSLPLGKWRWLGRKASARYAAAI